MDAPKIIMAPTDLSNRSEVAVDYAATLAEKFGADLVLFTNVNGPEEEELADYGRVEGLTIGDAAQAALKLSAHTNAPGSEVARIVAFEAQAADGILTAAKDCSADLIVMASHGRSGMSRWMLGSVTEKIVRSSAVPVLVVPVRD